MIEGAYKFELTVTDNKYATGKDTVSVFIKSVIPLSKNSFIVYPNPVVSSTTVDINTTVVKQQC